jgi:hypothetical protein
MLGASSVGPLDYKIDALNHLADTAAELNEIENLLWEK